jgi:putative oxidoreductase
LWLTGIFSFFKNVVMSRNYWITIVCFLLIFLFVYTSVNKLWDFKTYTGEMYNQPLPLPVKKVLLWAVPFSELLVAGLLFFNTTRLAGLYGSLFLMLAFTIYTAIILLRFFDYVPCSCSGVIKSLTWQQHLVFNLFFTAITLIGIIKYPLKTEHKIEQLL